MLRSSDSSESVPRINEASNAIRIEEDRLFALRTAAADWTQQFASAVTVAGSGLVVLLGGISIFLVRRSNRARDVAEAQLRDNNLKLAASVERDPAHPGTRIVLRCPYTGKTETKAGVETAGQH